MSTATFGIGRSSCFNGGPSGGYLAGHESALTTTTPLSSIGFTSRASPVAAPRATAVEPDRRDAAGTGARVQRLTVGKIGAEEWR